MVAEMSSTDRGAVPSEGMEVRGAAGRLLGKIGQVNEDADGQTTSIVVQHGMLGRKQKQVPASAIKQVTDASVVLCFTVVEFKELPNLR